MPHVKGREGFYDACELFVGNCLRRGRSLFTAGSEIWVPEPVSVLYERFVENPDEAKGNFVPKLVGQLEGTSADVVQLAAEMLYVLLLPQDTAGAGKRELVEEVLRASPEPVTVPDELAGALDRGIASFGAALAHRFRQYVFLCEFARSWVALQSGERGELLGDGLAFQEFLKTVPRQGAQSMVEALLHIVFPDSFEPIVSVESKSKIASAFAEYVDDPAAPLDVRLQAIRAVLTPEFGADFNFWDEGLAERWQGDQKNAGRPEPPPSPPGGSEDIHLVVKWSSRYEPRTIELHQEVVESHGAVWWALFSQAEQPTIAEQWTDSLRAQLEAGRTTYVFISGQTCWRTRLLALETDRATVEPELIPLYYERLQGLQFAWLKITDFEPVARDELLRLLDPARKPGKPVALGNQATPLFVRLRSKPRVWWVNQGSTYVREHAGGYLWAPIVDKNGRELDHWRAMRHLRTGDIVLNYANTRLRAWSTVTAEATPSPRPDPAADDSWTDDGFRAELEYQELQEPVRLSDIPTEWRRAEGAPFTTDGGVRQGYLFGVSDEFASKLQGKFPQLNFESIGEAPAPPTAASPAPTHGIDALRVEDVGAAIRERQLLLDPAIAVQTVAALRSGKHVIFTGPPGTAKTTLAETIASVAAANGICAGYLMTTATADWTTYETIGGLKPDVDAGLSFQEGHFLDAIEKNQWLVIDELNRSNFDRAFGQLFTVLSGQAVELPYERRAGGGRVALVPAGATHGFLGADILEVPASWRVIATMNVFDKSLLFEMSFALMRRFAFIEVPSPPREDFERLIDQQVGGDEEAAATARQLLKLRDLKDLGPAVFIDLARFLRERRSAGPGEPGQLAFEAFYSYLLPQFEGIDEVEGDRLFREMRKLVGSPLAGRLRTTLVNVLGLESLAPALQVTPEDELGEPVEDALEPDEPLVIPEVDGSGA